ncbi:MAG: DinB family protein [Gemmatimonadota bacterium]
MHPRLADLLAHADQTRAELLAFLDTIPEAPFGATRDDGAWCPAQHAAHLHLVEASSLRALFRAFRKARSEGLGDETESSSLVGALDDTDLVAGSKKLVAPDFTQPAEAPDRATVRERLSTSRAGLHAWAAEADGFALAQVHFPHPALGTLNLYEWVAMIDGHERRHLRLMQAQLAEPTR